MCIVTKQLTWHSHLHTHISVRPYRLDPINCKYTHTLTFALSITSRKKQKAIMSMRAPNWRCYLYNCCRNNLPGLHYVALPIRLSTQSQLTRSLSSSSPWPRSVAGAPILDTTSTKQTNFLTRANSNLLQPFYVPTFHTHLSFTLLSALCVNNCFVLEKIVYLICPRDAYLHTTLFNKWQWNNKCR